MPFGFAQPAVALGLICHYGWNENSPQYWTSFVVALVFQVTSRLLVWVCMHVLLQFIRDLEAQTVVDTKLDALQDLARGAWVGSPGLLSARKLAFFRLVELSGSNDVAHSKGTIKKYGLAWGWNDRIPLHHIDGVTQSDTTLVLTIKPSFKPDMRLQFYDPECYEDWKAGLAALCTHRIPAGSAQTSGTGRATALQRWQPTEISSAHLNDLEEDEDSFCGSGGQGDVTIYRLCQDGQGTVEKVAVKDCRDPEVAQREIFMHMAAGVTEPTVSSPDNWHPGIVKVYGQVNEEGSQKIARLRIVMRYEWRGSLLDWLKAQPTDNAPIRETVARIIADVIPGPRMGIKASPTSVTRNMDTAKLLKFMLSFAEAVQHLHSLKILHRDLKPENLLIGEKQTIRICDFGMARFLGEQPGMLRNSMSRMTRHNVGTLAYAAPEILKLADNAEAGSIWLKADVWSFGATLYHMLAGKRPRSHLPEFSEQQPLGRTSIALAQRTGEQLQSTMTEAEVRILKRGKQPNEEEVLQSLVDLSEKCQELDQDRRPTIDDVAQGLKGISNRFATG
mmetsp:Transcript_8039/g.23794  ORF Transcript_8039/g.23794 Transcript_8039/m.23794 type:complete len:561 (-) Transcript_8039:499-2181(-)